MYTDKPEAALDAAEVVRVGGAAVEVGVVGGKPFARTRVAVPGELSNPASHPSPSKQPERVPWLRPPAYWRQST
ncbi:MAG: hypothetical protein KF901_22945 [Myxococcales bacterium]|nr:hypothetical protein [Myxococcales bacterium]